MLALFVASIVFVYRPVLKKLRNLGQCQADCTIPIYFETILSCILGCQYLLLQTCGAMLSLNQAGSAAIAPTSSSGSTVEIEIRAGESTTSTTRLDKEKVEPGSPPDASTGVVKVEPTDSRSADGKLAAAEFEEQVALWARQCAGFRKRATWMPTRPGAGFQEEDSFGP